MTEWITDWMAEWMEWMNEWSNERKNEGVFELMTDWIKEKITDIMKA